MATHKHHNNIKNNNKNKRTDCKLLPAFFIAKWGVTVTVFPHGFVDFITARRSDDGYLTLSFASQLDFEFHTELVSVMRVQVTLSKASIYVKTIPLYVSLTQPILTNNITIVPSDSNTAP